MGCRRTADRRPEERPARKWKAGGWGISGLLERRTRDARERTGLGGWFWGAIGHCEDVRTGVIHYVSGNTFAN
jgi:hypothetical protein